MSCDVPQDAVKKLRAVDACAEHAQSDLDLWRGCRDVTMPEEFLRMGGTELAPMSTTRDLAMAVRYSYSANAVLLRLRTDNFLQRGADLSWCSAFPREAELLFPPLTYLGPTGDPPVTVTVGHASFTVIDVRPQM